MTYKQKITQANVIHTMAIPAMMRDQRPRCHGPLRKRWLQIKRLPMGMAYATYGPRMANVKMALPISQCNRPSTQRRR